jgi:hypothetical protein
MSRQIFLSHWKFEFESPSYESLFKWELFQFFLQSFRKISLEWRITELLNFFIVLFYNLCLYARTSLKIPNWKDLWLHSTRKGRQKVFLKRALLIIGHCLLVSSFVNNSNEWEGKMPSGTIMKWIYESLKNIFFHTNEIQLETLFPYENILIISNKMTRT